MTLTGYRFLISASDDNSDYTLEAIPIMNKETKKHFLTDVSGVIRWERGSNATSESPEI